MNAKVQAYLDAAASIFGVTESQIMSGETEEARMADLAVAMCCDCDPDVSIIDAAWVYFGDVQAARAAVAQAEMLLGSDPGFADKVHRIADLGEITTEAE
jgi:hypothetical protein